MRRTKFGAIRTSWRAPSLPWSSRSPPGSSMATSSAQTEAARSASRASSAAMNVRAASRASIGGHYYGVPRKALDLLPYAAFAVLIVGVTVAALVLTTLGMPIAAPPAATASPSAAATAVTARPVTDLSPSGRLAYWRAEPSGEFLLWLANADNSRRRSVAKADQPAAIGRTKWAADGNAIAYVESGVRLVVV